MKTNIQSNSFSLLEKGVLAAVCDQAARRPDAVAVITDKNRTSFAELLDMAAFFSRELDSRIQPAGSSPRIVGVMLERSEQWVALLLAIFGGQYVYLPLDPNLPDARIREVLEEATPELVICGSASDMERLTGLGGKAIRLSCSMEEEGAGGTA